MSSTSKTTSTATATARDIFSKKPYKRNLIILISAFFVIKVKNNMISGSISSVSDTKILVARVYPAKLVKMVKDGENVTVKIPHGNAMQLVVYSNCVTKGHSRGPTALILPFPIPKNGGRFSFLHLDDFPDIFNKLDSMFKSEKSNFAEFERHFDSNILKNMGYYKVSVASSLRKLREISEANLDLFRLESSVMDKLKTYYKTGYGFVICVIDDSNIFRPFGYLHEMREDGSLFVPTRYFYNDTGNDPLNLEIDADDALESFNMKTILQEDKYLEMKLKRRAYNREARIGWDHKIFVINKSSVAKSKLAEHKYVHVKVASRKKMKKVNIYLPAKNFPKSFTFKEIKTVTKIKISSGYTVNGDLFL